MSKSIAKRLTKSKRKAMKLEQPLSINEWITNCLEGSEGFVTYKEFRCDTDEMLSANWIINCLTNPKCEGSEEILQMIVAMRNEINSD